MVHHHTTITVRFAELDPYGHVNHAAYITYFEVGRTDALESCGVELVALAVQGIQLVVTRLEVDYRRSAGPGDRLVVETGIVELRRASSRWRQRVTRDGETLVSAEVTAAVVGGDGRPVRPPADLFPALEPLLG
jgi:acyl-CoA thioester hydrolase